MNSYRFFCPPRYQFLRRKFGRNDSFRMLDVGAGHNSYEIVRHYFPNAEFHAIDRHPQKADTFFQIHLEKEPLDAVPNGAYDAIVFSHTIEHLRNGLEVLKSLVPKLKIGGQLYVEFPSERSMYLPPADGTLSFFDDPTHVNFVDVKDVANALLAANVRVLKVGTARHLARSLVLTPLSLAYNVYYVARHRRLSARGLLDVAGYGSYVLGVRHEYPPDRRLGSWRETEALYAR